MSVRRAAGARALLGPAVGLAGATGAVCVVVGAAMAGLEGALAAGLGLGLVLAFLLVGQLPLAQVRGARPVSGAVLLLLGYVLRVWLLLVAFVVVTQTGVPDRSVLGLTVIAVALGWTIGTVWTWARWRPMVVEVELPSRPLIGSSGDGQGPV